MYGINLVFEPMFLLLDITIGFSQSEFPEDEGNEFVIVTVEIKTGMAERSFKFHVETFEQQAQAGMGQVKYSSKLSLFCLLDKYISLI